ncbi:MAG: hypothetical protein M4D80_39645 [Myxococcota bacterium]|nr:hypothetical protein [Myxococcota bacterium]
MSLVAACGPRYAKTDGVALGRVVIYRNGVAYYERRATVSDGELTVRVPRERVDDFLKSLTVVDAISRQPLPVSIPRRQDDGATLVMKLQLPGKGTADVLLTYVTEAPAWKPSYRVVVGERGTASEGKVMLEGWAVVDNTSGEDWNGVLVGVGSSSALSFRYDLWSVRTVQREQLQDQASFAVAPPTGVSPYTAETADEDVVVAELDSKEVEVHKESTNKLLKPLEPSPQRRTNKLSKDIAVRHRGKDVAARNRLDRMKAIKVDPSAGVLGGGGGGGGGGKVKATSSSGFSGEYWRDELGYYRRAADVKLKAAVAEVLKSNKIIVLEGGQAHANLVRDQLIDKGVPAARIKIVPTDATGVRILATAPDAEQKKRAPAEAIDLHAAPVGETHFASKTPMTIERGASAMVSMVRDETEGEVVYLYDAESTRGNAHFAFRAVRFRNPTTSTLETGPVTVYGNERFIGEGLTEAIPPRAAAVVPYALDRQIVVEHAAGDEDRISKLVTLQRGVLTAQVQHVRRRKLAITNRLSTPAKVFIRHTVAKGATLLDAPKGVERVGGAHLFYVELAASSVTNVEIAEATPVVRTLDLGADATLEMMKVFVEAPEGGKELKDQMKKLLAVHKTMIDLATEQGSLRRRLSDYKERMDELHAQIVTLQAVKTGGDLMAHLKTKMKEISNRVQATTIGIVDQEQKIMLARVRFQDMLAELSMPDAIAASPR